jgi:hypothetical protein
MYALVLARALALTRAAPHCTASFARPARFTARLARLPVAPAQPQDRKPARHRRVQAGHGRADVGAGLPGRRWEGRVLGGAVSIKLRSEAVRSVSMLCSIVQRGISKGKRLERYLCLLCSTMQY